MLKNIIFYFLGVIIISSSINCGGSEVIDKGSNNDNGDKKEQVSQNGFKYVHVIQNEGPKPQVGEYAAYELEVYAVYEDLSIANFVEGGQHYSKTLDISKTKGFTSPIIDVLRFMAVGDSVTVKQYPETIENLAPAYADISYFRYQVKLTDIMSAKDHSNLQIELFNKRKEQLLAGRAKMDELLASGKQFLADYKANKLGDKLVESKSGVKYYIVEEGYGKTLRTGNVVNIWDYGLLMDGTVFENTFETGSIKFIQVGKESGVPGWEEALTYLKKGTKAFVIIPYQMAYGDDGLPPTIPPKSDIMYYVELME